MADNESDALPEPLHLNECAHLFMPPPPFAEVCLHACLSVCLSAPLSACPSVRNLFVSKINSSRTPWLIFLKLSPHIHPDEQMKPFWFWGYWVKGQGHRGQMCQNCFRSITGKGLDLNPGPYIRPGQQRTPIDFGFTGSKVKLTGVKYIKTVSDCLRNNFPKWISSWYICATCELTYQVLQNICDNCFI